MNYARLFGIAPFGIGLTTLGFLWLSPWNEFGSPPLFFRIFGSFVAFPFVVIGGGILFGNHTSLIERMKTLKREMEESGLATPTSSSSSSPPVLGKLKCPNCGSSPGASEVSPHGDVKCEHCSRWYNVHTA